MTLTAGVGIESEAGEWITVARGTDGEEGSGVYLVGHDRNGQSGNGTAAVLKELREKDMVRRLWLHTVSEFTRITGSVFVQ